MARIRLIAALVYMVVWGVAVIVFAIKDGKVPPEFWTLPGIGIGGLMVALGYAEKQSSSKTKVEPPDNDDTVKES